MMSKFEFQQNIKQFNDIKNGIRDLEERIAKMKTTKVKDSVKGSHKDFPYTEHTCVVEGIKDDYGALDRRKKVLQGKYDELNRLKIDMEEFINTGIRDEHLRQVLEYKYVDELTYIQIAHRIGGSADSIRMEVTRFLKEK